MEKFFVYIFGAAFWLDIMFIAGACEADNFGLAFILLGVLGLMVYYMNHSKTFAKAMEKIDKDIDKFLK